MGAWLLPMFGSSLTFAIADVLCDVVIVERAPAGSEESGANDDGDDERELPEQISEAEAELQPILPPSEHRNGDAAELSPGRSSKRARSSSTVSTPRAGSLEVAEAEGLTGEQDTAMAGAGARGHTRAPCTRARGLDARVTRALLSRPRAARSRAPAAPAPRAQAL